MGDYPGLKLVKPKVGFDKISEWAREHGLQIRELQSRFEKWGWPGGWHPTKRKKFLGLFYIGKIPEQQKIREWEVVGHNEIGIILVTPLYGMERWPKQRQKALESFIRKLQQNSKALYYFRDFNGLHWSYLMEEGRIPWKDVPKESIIKFLLENR
ncbi:MAG: hypothetical protein ACE5J7_01305 [Candidatus Aenigmatarchaeota archaeon]